MEDVTTRLFDGPQTARCPTTGSPVFVRSGLLSVAEPISVACPACGQWHVWDPETLRLIGAPNSRMVSAVH